MSGTGVVADTDDPFANVAVNVGGCSGTLISPTAVLTAAHCVVGAADRGGAEDNRYVTVVIGNTLASTRRHTSVGYVSRVFPGPAHGWADNGDDIALVFMDPTASDAYELASAYAFRPTLQVPTPAFPEASGSCGNGAVRSGYYTNIGAAGWDGDTFRSTVLRVGTTASTDLGMNTCKSDPNVGGVDFDFFLNGWTNCRGDSGGTLFVMNPVSQSASTTTELSGHPFRDVIGVMSTIGGLDPNALCGPPTYVDFVDPFFYGTCKADSDCTKGGVCVDKACKTDSLAVWINDHMLDGALQVTTSGSYQGRSGEWLKRHGKDPQSLNGQPFWRGEVDYIGHCKNPLVTTASLEANGGKPTADQIKTCIKNGGEDCDCDHWDNVHDNCVFAYNPDQSWTNEPVDPNGNPIGDACKFCPCDPDNDVDGDGRCAVLCPWQIAEGQFVDNCPTVTNQDQANCNVDFEIAHQADGIDIRGDACDPVPCPVPNPISSLTPDANAPQCSNLLNATCGSVGCSTGCVSNCDVNNMPNGTCQCCGTGNHNTIFTSTIAAHEATPPPPNNVAVAVPVGPGDTGVAVTVMRFCQQDQTSNVLCDVPNVLNDIQLTTDSAVIDPTHPWHRVHTQVAGNAFNPVILDRKITTWTYGISNDTFNWVYATDFNQGSQSWLADPNNPIIPGCTTGTPPNATALPVTCLHGTWWTSGATDVGKLIDTVIYNSVSYVVGNHVPGTFDGIGFLTGSWS